MQKYFYLDAEHHTGPPFHDPYSFHSSSSSSLGFPSFPDHKPLLFDHPDQTSTTSLVSHPFPLFTTPLISNDNFHVHPESSLDSITHTTNFKVPKTEPQQTGFVKQLDHISNQASLFQLPNLWSLEEKLDTESKLETQSSSQLSSPHATRLKYERQRDLARQRRQRVREKIESLKELLPAHKNKRLDTAMVLENAGKYIKFLEAQVNVLKGMPVDDCLGNENTSLNNGGGVLSRNKVLRMLVNSEMSQGKMSAEGMCVYSVEQLVEIIGRLFSSEEASVILNSMLFSSFAPL